MGASVRGGAASLAAPARWRKSGRDGMGDGIVGGARRADTIVPVDASAMAGILDQSPDPVFVKDARHRWIYANAAFRALLGGGEVVGRDDRDFFPPEQVAVFWAGDDAVIHEGRALAQEEAIGPSVWAIVKKWPIRLADGAPGLFGLIVDISDYRARALEAEKLRAAALARSTFLAGMSHELRTPLNGVLGIARLIERHAQALGEPKLAELCAVLLNSSRQIVGVVEDLFDAARLEGGRLSLGSAPFDLAAAVREPVALLSPLAEARGLWLRVDEGGVAARVLGDGLRLRQIVTNLVGNAIKFTDTGGVAVSLRAASAGGGLLRATLEVADTGPGVAPEHQARIFEPFTQIDPDPSRAGAGLGLSISRELARLMGGELSLRSRPGEGATFSLQLTLPHQSEARQSAAGQD